MKEIATNIIPLIIALVSGGGFLYYRENKRSKNIDNEVKIINEYKELLETYKKEKEFYMEKVDELTKEMDEVKRQLAVVQEQLATSNMLYMSANAIRCDVLDCPNRKPPLDKEFLERIAGMPINS